MSSDILKSKDFQQILQEKLHVNNFKVVNGVLKSLAFGEGFMGDHYKLELTYELGNERRVEYFFVKTVPKQNVVLKDVVEGTSVFALEIFLYEFLFREFEKFGIDISFAPKCYYCIANKTIVMDDLAALGYCLPNPRSFFNFEECQAGLKELASYHAAGLVYELMKSEELGRDFRLGTEYPEMLEEKFITYYFENRNLQGERWFTVSMETFHELIDLLPDSEEFKTDFHKRLRRFPYGKVFAENSSIRRFLSHGDLWSNNVMFKRVHDKIEDCCLFDFQCARYFYPSYDVLIFLVITTHPKFFQKHSEELFNFYYDMLTKHVAKHNLSISQYFPEEDFWKSLEMVKFEGKFQGYSEHSFFIIPPEFVEKFLPPGEHLLQFKFANRLKLTKEYFKANAEFRHIISIDLYDLYQVLLTYEM